MKHFNNHTIQKDETLKRIAALYDFPEEGLKMFHNNHCILKEQILINILKLNGKPTHQVSDKAHVDEKFDKKLFSQFKKIFPQDVFWIIDEPNYFRYPYAFFWKKENSYSILSFTIDFDGEIRNTYTSVTKEAFKNNITKGLKSPQPKESPWYNYLK